MEAAQIEFHVIDGVNIMLLHNNILEQGADAGATNVNGDTLAHYATRNQGPRDNEDMFNVFGIFEAVIHIASLRDMPKVVGETPRRNNN
ncbi:hypothetical protein PG984_008757 [Apiospora sp. TS-2023a]